MRFAVSTALPALMMAACPVAAQTIPPVADGTLLTVSAQGRAHRTPDVATVRAGVVAQAPTAAAALAASAAAMGRALAALRAAGVQARDAATNTLSLQPQQRYQEGRPPEITGDQAVNSVSVRLRDLAAAGRVLDALVAAGVNQIEGPSLSLAEPDDALNEARADSVRRARARAELYAAAASLRVERIASIDEHSENAGGLPIPVFRRMASAAAAPTPVLAGESDVTAAVQVRFVL